MRFTKFQFQNFRGIGSATLDLNRAPKEAVNVLVGLNESGKTTVLEAINHFRSNPNLKSKDPNSGTVRNDADYQAMLPIGSRALFNGVVSIKSTLNIEQNDADKIDEFLKSEFGFVEVNYKRDFYIDNKVIFESSQRKSLNNTWSISFEGRRKRGNTSFITLKDDD